MRPIGIVLAMCLATAGLFAQAPVKDPAASPGGASGLSHDAFPLRAIHVEGNKHFTSGAIVALTGLKTGEQASPADFERALRRISDAGVFESVAFRYGPKGDGYQVTFEVEEVADLYPVRLQGFEGAEEDLLALLKEKIPLFGPKVPPTGTMVERIGDVLQTHWRSQGHDSKVIGRMASVGPEEFEMVFAPETRLESISFVKFRGSEAVSVLDLQRRFNQVAIGVPYSEPRLKELLHHNVRPMFEAAGRMDVEFCPCTTEPDPNSQGLLVTVEVSDGPEYKFGKITLPESAVIEADRLRRMIRAAEGERVDMAALRESLAQVEEAMRRQGYMKAEGRYEPRQDRESLTVDVAVELIPGAQYTLGRLEIRGLDIVSEPIIRKRWGIAIGEPFDAGYPPFFLSRIREEQMFENLTRTDWRMEIDETQKTVAVTLLFFGAADDPDRPQYLPQPPDPL